MISKIPFILSIDLIIHNLLRFGQIISSDVVHPVELTENFVEAVNEDADFVKVYIKIGVDSTILVLSKDIF